MLDSDIEKNKAAREAVDLVLQHIEQDVLDPKTLNVNRFYEVLAVRSADKVGKVISTPDSKEPLTQHEIVKFENSQVPFGIHKGERVIDVDHKYWSHVRDCDFSEMLDKWMRTKRFRDLQGG